MKNGLDWEAMWRFGICNYTKSLKEPLSKVKELKSGLRYKVHNINDSSGKLLTNKTDIKDRWKQYCSELYNYELNVDKATLDQLWSNHQHTEEPDIMESEVRAAIIKLKTGKMPGTDRLEGDLIKASGDTIVKIMHKICNNIWATGQISGTMETIVNCNHTKKGDTSKCENLRILS